MIMDLIVLVIFALTIFISIRRGFALCLAKFTKGIVSVVISWLVCDDIARFLIDRSPVGERVSEKIASKLSFKWEQSDIYNAIPKLFKEGTSNFSGELITRGASKITELILVILCFILVLVILRAVLGLFVRVAKRSRRKNGVAGKVDKIFGLLLGSITGAFYVFLFLALLLPVGGLFFPEHLPQIMGWFDGSIYSQDLYDNNLILILFRNYLLK